MKTSLTKNLLLAASALLSGCLTVPGAAPDGGAGSGDGSVQADGPDADPLAPDAQPSSGPDAALPPWVGSSYYLTWTFMDYGEDGPPCTAKINIATDTLDLAVDHGTFRSTNCPVGDPETVVGIVQINDWIQMGNGWKAYNCTGTLYELALEPPSVMSADGWQTLTGGYFTKRYTSADVYQCDANYEFSGSKI